MGHAYFRSKFFTDNLKGIYTYAQQVFTPTLALPPAMTWENSKLPSPPTDLNTSEENGKAFVSWRGGRSANNSPYILYNVYASSSYPVDVTDGRNLIAMRYAKNSIEVSPRNAQMYFAITTMDRYGNESQPLQTRKAAGGSRSELKMLAYSDGKVLLPKSADALWGRVWVVETLQGQHVATLSSVNDKLDVRGIANGVYVLRALNNKGVGHRLGMFTKRWIRGLFD